MYDQRENVFFFFMSFEIFIYIIIFGFENFENNVSRSSRRILRILLSQRARVFQFYRRTKPSYRMQREAGLGEFIAPFSNLLSQYTVKIL